MNRVASIGTFLRLTVLLIALAAFGSIATRHATGADDTPTPSPASTESVVSTEAATSATSAPTPSTTATPTHAATLAPSSSATPTALPTVVGGLTPILTVRY